MCHKWVSKSALHYLYTSRCIKCKTFYFVNTHLLSNLYESNILILIGKCNVHAKSLQLCPTLCHPMDCSPPGCSVHGILQVRILEWVAIFSYRGSFQPRDQTTSLMCPALAGRFFITGATWEA